MSHFISSTIITGKETFFFFFLIKWEREKVTRTEPIIAAKPVPVETTSPAAKRWELSPLKFSHRLSPFLLGFGLALNLGLLLS